MKNEDIRTLIERLHERCENPENWDTLAFEAAKVLSLLLDEHEALSEKPIDWDKVRKAYLAVEDA